METAVQTQQAPSVATRSANLPLTTTKAETNSLDLVMLEGKNAVVLGATGRAGTRAVNQLLDNSARVVIVAPDEDSKKSFLDQFPQAVQNGKLLGVVGKYTSRNDLNEILKSVKTVLGPDVNIDHVVSSVDYRAESKTTESKGTWDDLILRNEFERSFYPTMWAADTFFPLLQRPQTSFTLIDEFFPSRFFLLAKQTANSLLLAYTPMDTQFWPYTVSDAATDAFLSMAALQNELTRVSWRRALREV